MRVFIISPSDLKYTYRGTEKLAFETARGLREMGIDVEILISDVETVTPHRKIDIQPREDWEDIKHLYAGIPIKHIRALKFAFPGGYSPIVFYRDLPKDSLIWAMENPHSAFLNIFQDQERIRILGSVGVLMRPDWNPFRKILDHALDALFFGSLRGNRRLYYPVISTAQKRYLLRMGIAEDRIFHFLPFIDTKPFLRNLDLAISLDNKLRLRIVHIGGADKSASTIASVIELLEMVKGLDSFEFYLIGREQPKKILELARKHENIHVLGRIGDREKYGLMPCMDVLIAPDYEGYSVAMVEALSSGLYVLADSRNPGAKDVKEMGANIWFAKHPAVYVQNLIRLLRRKKNARFWNEGRFKNLRVAEEFDRWTVLPQIKNMFDDIEARDKFKRIAT